MSEGLARRWDLTVDDGGDVYPSWVDLAAGQFVGRVGSARPIVEKTIEGDKATWRLPKQYESRTDDLVFEGTLADSGLRGTTTNEKGETISWTGEPAPDFAPREAVFEPALELVGSDLAGWHPRSPDGDNHWSISEEGLENSAVGTDLVTDLTFEDFRLTAEYMVPKGSNSGIYLRGRYEFQILDDFGTDAHVGGSGAIYGFLAPTRNAVLPADAWNMAIITLIGRTITVNLNGEDVISGVEIPGITGGALDSNEGAPGPLFVQGDHGPVTYRRLSVERALPRSAA